MAGRRRGQVLVEMAIVLPLLVVILTAIFEFGFYFYTLATVCNTTRLAARVGSNGQDNAAIADAVNRIKGSTNVTSITVTVTTSSGSSVANTDRTTGNYIAVEVVVPYGSLTRLVDLSRIAGITQIKNKSVFLIAY